MPEEFEGGTPPQERKEGRELKKIGKTTEQQVVSFLKSRCSSPLMNEGRDWFSKYGQDPNMIPVSTGSMGIREYNTDAKVDHLDASPEEYRRNEVHALYGILDVLDVQKLKWFKYRSVCGSDLKFTRNDEGGFDVEGINLGINTGQRIEGMTGKKLDPSFMNKKEVDAIEERSFDSEENKIAFEDFLSRVRG